MNPDNHQIKPAGANTLRVEGHDKLRGKAQYVDDVNFPGMIYGATVRSTIQRGIFKDLIFEEGINWQEFTIVTAQDIPGNNYVAMIENDWPYLIDKGQEIKFNGEALALIAHPDKYLLQKALKHIKATYKELSPINSIEEARNNHKPALRQKNNLIKEYLIDKGDVDKVWSKAHKIVEGSYATGAQEQLYIENNGMIAMANEQEGVTVWGSLQCPYYIHDALMALFNWPEDKVRVIQMETGGGFGGKEEFPSLLAGHASLLAFKAKRPVKMIYSRSEDMAYTTKRHPSLTKIKTAVDKSGKILAQEIEFNLDGGAYVTLTPVVLSRGAIHAPGPYQCPHVRVLARAYATNHFPYGAFRGFGAPQSIFALERHLDVVAAKLKMDPIDFRRKNFLLKGELTATGQKIDELIDFNTLMDKALEHAHYYDKLLKYKKENQQGPIKRGLGVASFMHGAGFTGSGEVMLASQASVTLNAKGQVVGLASSVEMGQGKNTIFTQIMAKKLGLNTCDIVIQRPDTKYVPDSGPTVASRTCMVVGKLLEKACGKLLAHLQKEASLPKNYTADEFKQVAKKYFEEKGPPLLTAKYQPPQNVFWDDQKYQGDAYATYAWAVYVADVEVNTLTYETKVHHFTAVQEIGHALNPLLAKGQIEGGVAQAIGMAIYEKVRLKDGVMINNQMTNYIMPTAADVPQIDVYFEEWNKQHGPSGAKGIGELPMDGPAPAILNAITNALGEKLKTPLHFTPFLPEDLMLTLGE